MDINQERELSLVGHLTELRARLIVSLVTLVITVTLSIFIANPVLKVLTQPVTTMKKEPGRADAMTFLVGSDGTLKLENPSQAKADLEHISRKHFTLIWPADPQTKQPEARIIFGESPSQKFYYHSPLDPVMMQFKVAIIIGILLSLPIILWQIWMFIAPGLTSKEQKIVRPMLGAALILFPLGAAFAYYAMKFMLVIMQVYAVENIDPMLSIFSYLSLLFTMMLICGFIFEIPLAVAIAARIGLITPKFLQQYRRHAYVVLSIAAMVLTPGTDPISMIAALVPLVALFELSIALAIPMAKMHERDLRHAAEEESSDETAA